MAPGIEKLCGFLGSLRLSVPGRRVAVSAVLPQIIECPCDLVFTGCILYVRVCEYGYIVLDVMRGSKVGA